MAAKSAWTVSRRGLLKGTGAAAAAMAGGGPLSDNGGCVAVTVSRNLPIVWFVPKR